MDANALTRRFDLNTPYRKLARHPNARGATRHPVFALLAACFSVASTGCYHYHIVPDRVAPTTDSRTSTRVALLWGLAQPNDLVPWNCPKKVPLAEVTAQTNFGYVLLGMVTLGIVVIQDIEWQCAGLPGSNDTNVLGAAKTGRKVE